MIRFLFLFATWALAHVACVAQWSPPITIDPEGSIPLLVATGDLDNDGDLDVVSLASPAAATGDEIMLVHIYDHMSDKFMAKPYSYVFPSLNYYPHHIHIADLNGDGWLDILSTWRSGIMDQHCLTIIHYNNGSGVFLEPVILPVQQTYFSLVAMDIDADGDTDVVVRTPGDLVIYVNDGSGEFAEGGSVYVGPNGQNDRSMKCDLDGDAYPDLAFAGMNSVRLFQNTGQGFVEQVEIPSYAPIFLADMNGDGLDDLVDRYVDAIRIRTNLGGLNFSPPVLLENVFEPWVTYGWHPMDLDGDDDMDLVVRSQTSDNVFALILLKNDGGLSFTPDTLIPGGREITNVSTVHSWENDGVNNVLVTSLYRLFRYELLPGPSLQLKGSLTNHISPNWHERSAHVADIDMDGTLDLVLASFPERFVWYYPDVSSNHRYQRFLYHLDDEMLDVGVADVDQDGAPDLLIQTPSGTFIHWNLGEGQFSGPAVPGGTVAIDLDGDGDLDLLERQTINAPPRIYRNLGNGAFQMVTMPQGGPDSYEFLEAIDMDGDGFLDPIYRRNVNTGRVWSSENDYGTTSYDLNTPGVRSVLAIDVEPDGNMDMIIVSAINDVVLYRNQPGQVPPWSPGETLMQPGICTGCRSMALDANKDGYTDVIAYGMNGSYLLLNDTQGDLHEAEVFPPGESFLYEAMVADLDADGDDDIVYLQGATLKWIENYALHPNTITGTVFADLNGNGQLDDGEPGIPMAALSTQPANFIQFSGASGAFTVYSDLGVQEVSVYFNTPLWTLSTGSASMTVELTDDAPQAEGLLFGFAPAVDSSLVEVTSVVASSTCNDITTMWVDLSNQGTRHEIATVSVDLDVNWTFITADPAPVSNTNGVLVWAPENLGLFQNFSIAIQLQVPDVDQIGTELIDHITVNSTDPNGADPMTFTATSSYVNNCAYDPNDKLVEPAGFGLFNAIPLDTEELTFTIRFQNTGNATATNVMLRDRLDAALVPAGITVAGASHEISEVYVEPDNELVVKFNGIMLPDTATDMAGSQGYFTFRIPVAEGVSHMTGIQNKAGIYFDLNPPIITNTTDVLLIDCSTFAPMIDPAGAELIASEGVSYQWYLDEQPLPGATQPVLAIGQAGVYTVEVTSVFGCTALSGEYMVMSLGVAMQETGTLIFPNPFDDRITLIHGSIITIDHRIELVDMLGRTVHALRGGGTNSIEINAAGLADGVYMLQLMDNGRKEGSWRVIRRSGGR